MVGPQGGAHHQVDGLDIGLVAVVGQIGEEADEAAEVVGQHGGRRRRGAQAQSDDGRPEGPVQAVELVSRSDAGRCRVHDGPIAGDDAGVDRAVRGRDDVFRAGRVAAPDREEGRRDGAVPHPGQETDAGGGHTAFLGGDRAVQYQAQVTATVGVAPPSPVPHPHRQGETFQDDRVVGVRCTVAFEPHRDPRSHLGQGPRRRGVQRLWCGLSARRDADRAGRCVLAVPGGAAGERSGRAEQTAGVDAATQRDSPDPPSGGWRTPGPSPAVGQASEALRAPVSAGSPERTPS